MAKKADKEKTQNRPTRLGDRVRAELAGITMGMVCAFLVLALASFSSSDPSRSTATDSGQVENLVGVAGSHAADALIQALGYAAYLIPLALGIFALRYMALKPVKYPGWVSLGYTWLTVVLAGLLAVLAGYARFDQDLLPAGGAIGLLVAEIMVPFFNKAGTVLILGVAFLCAFMFTINFSLFSFWEGVRFRILNFFRKVEARRIIRKEQKAKKKARKEKTVTAKEKKEKKAQPKIVIDSGPAGGKSASQETFAFAEESGGFKIPPVEIFTEEEKLTDAHDEESLLMASKLLTKKLKDFNIEGTVETVHPGPVITMFEFKPAAGVKINRIVNLQDDLALALRALSIRIVAPIPGKDTVGIEIPNREREIVSLREVFESKEYKGAKSVLTMALGKDISGAPRVSELDRMPHLLIAGATGSGKSVAIHAMLASLLKRSTPEKVKLLIIDPKMLELSVYDDIPHLLLPVVTEAKEAALALRWAVAEMERRYRLMAEESVRNITTYNRKVEARLKAGKLQEGDNAEVFPYIVVIIDELADLMMVSSKEVEESIARLAQMARASGIHLIVATQRPSVDVITGMIKANFPARIAFQVASKIDSRTILDTGGAETLLGSGDMLFMPPGSAKVERLHGAFVSEEDISKLVKFLKTQGTPEYDESILEPPQGDELDGDGEFDELYDHAVQLVTEKRQASVSMIQRKFKIGYNRAARLVEQMERDGVVGPSRGAKPREVLAQKM